MRITRAWAMPNRWTCAIPPIQSLMLRYIGDGEGWIDPFAGCCSLARIRNDINPKRKADYCMEALEFLKLLARLKQQFNGVIFDPPYSGRQVKECYDGHGMNVTRDDTNGAFRAQRVRVAAKLIRPGGLAICCGWNSSGFGQSFGEIIEILIVAHGGSHNDTIVTVQRKRKEDA